MKLSAVTLAAVAAFASSQARAELNLTCSITDNQNNAMVYDFVTATDDPQAAIAERSYSKNGVVTTHERNNLPYWSAALNSDETVVTLWSRKGKGWAIHAFTKNGTSPGNASLQAPSGKIVGHGTCVMASYAPVPTVEAATPSSRPAPGDLSKYLDM
jgi:hypothetical protein